MSSYVSMSESCEDDHLDIALEKGEIIRNQYTGGK